MPSAIAAAPIAQRAFDLQRHTSSADASSFASSLHDAKQKLPSKRAAARDEENDAIDAAAAAKKPEAADRAADDQASPDADETRDVAAAEKPETKPEQEDASEDPDAYAQAMAALAAQQQQPGADAQAVAADGEQAGTDATAAIAAAAAAATKLPDDATIGTELAGAAAPTDPNAKPAVPAAKSGDAKLDALTAQMTPVDGSETTAPVTATNANAGNAESDGKGDADAQALALPDADAKKPSADEAKAKTFDELFSKLMPDDAMKPQAETKSVAPKVEAPPLRAEQQFAKDNVDRVVGSVQSQVNGSGNGSMRVRLDPPELGALDVAVKMLDGRMTASFTTSNEQATQLLSHSLNDLKTSLQNAGINVDRIEVKQAAPTSSASGDRNAGDQQQSDRGSASSQQQGEQQRKQMVDRLWRKYAYGSDEVDLVA